MPIIDNAMNQVSKTLYIPLYGKALVSRRGILLHDPWAEAIWEKEQFPLKRNSRSPWLAIFMSMRARVFDDWAGEQIDGGTVVLHIGCGMDSRYLRVKNGGKCWYDVDFPEVIAQRKTWFEEVPGYHLLGADASDPQWVAGLPEGQRAVVILEGISMYLKPRETQALFQALDRKYPRLSILMDVYTTLGARASRLKNPIQDVGVTQVYGIDDPRTVALDSGISFLREHDMTPEGLIGELHGFEKRFFSALFAGRLAKGMYRIYEYRK